MALLSLQAAMRSRWRSEPQLCALDQNNEDAQPVLSLIGEPVAIHVFGNLLTLLVIAVLYVVSQLFGSYILVIVYSMLVTEVLWPVKQAIVRSTHGILGDSIVGPLSVVLFCTVGALLCAGLFALGCMDFMEAVRMGHDTVLQMEFNASSLQYLGVSEDMISMGLAQVNKKLSDFESEYNSTAWWPIIDDIVSWGRSHSQGQCDLGVKAFIPNSTRLIDRAKMLVTIIGNEPDSAGNYLKDSLSLIPRVSSALLSILVAFSDGVTTSIFFVSLTSSLLASKKNLLDELVGGLFGDTTEHQLRRVLSGVFFYPAALAFLRWFYTMVASCLLAVPFPFLFTFLTFMLTAIPVLSFYPIVAAMPWIFHFFLNGDWIRAGLLSLSQYFVLGMMESMLVDTRVLIVPAWATGLSVLLGFERFGIQAFVVGPLSLSIAAMFYYAVFGINGSQPSFLHSASSGHLVPHSPHSGTASSSPRSPRRSTSREAGKKLSRFAAVVQQVLDNKKRQLPS